MKITIKDIARECGVSVSTVSLALSDKPSRISSDTRARIMEAAKRHHYQPNQAAVSLATKHSKWIGIIFNDLRNTHIASLFMAIDREIQPKGYTLVCHILNDDIEVPGSRIIQELAASNVAGIIWGKPYAYSEKDSNAAVMDYIDQAGLPVATMDEYGFTCRGIDVIFDYFQAGYLAAQHLLELGHTRIGCVTGAIDFKVTQERLRGYRKALVEAGIEYDENLIYHGDYTLQSGSDSLPYLLGQKATGIFSFNDEMAFGIYQSARQYGIKIPKDLSVIGCDNVPFANVMEVPLSTIHVPVEEMGKVMGRELVKAIEQENGSERSRIEYTPRVLLRGSTVKHQQ